MESSEIIAAVNEFLIDEFEIEAEEIKLEANLHETLDMDSLDYVDLVVVIQKTFGFKLVADDFKGVDTFNQFYVLIEDRLKKHEATK